tara:strand:- start:304 stop:480 length:177 start_codon:yes stop_codon:yes gene_type:complete
MEHKDKLKDIALVIIRAAVKTHGRAYVRKMIAGYQAIRPDYQAAIEEAFEEFSRGGRR